jgi:tRNA(Ile)-lysidine synthetase-like protein
MPLGIQESPLLISLSGGVDSMVLLWSLLQKRAAATAPQAPYPQAIAAVYIHYCNRGDMEEAFIREVCRSWNVPLYIRRIREIQRSPAMKLEMREAYETYTRRCRYHAYHHAHAHMTANAPAKPPIYIGLGHNHDDCFENILTNICHRQKYDNLKGMSSLSETEGILFWRPMLSVPKKTIYDLAQKNGIPYLEDSTPSWSCRGKIRDTIRPPMESFHPTFIQSFFELSHSLGELMTHLVETAQRLYDKTTFTGNTARLTVSAQDLPTVCWSSVRFWKCYFEFLYGGKSIPSHKSLSHFCERLNALRRPPIPGAEQPTQPTQIRAYLKKHLKVQVSHIKITSWTYGLATTSSVLHPTTSPRLPSLTASEDSSFVSYRSVYQFSFGFDDC